MALDSTLADGLSTEARAPASPDNARLRQAFVEHYPGIWRFLRRMGVTSQRVDDAAQHVFLIALEALPRIVRGSERAFLYGTAIRVAHGMRRRTEREVPGYDLDLDLSPLPRPDELADQKRARELLDDLLERMELDARTVFVLFELDGFTIPEIAQVLGIPLGTAASRLRRAREQFQSRVRLLRGPHGAEGRSTPERRDMQGEAKDT
jgi:RNA polymerase sigma-70 factor (ECF subfamily)